MRRDVGNVNSAVGLMLPNDMKGNVDMFSLLVLLRVVDEANGWLVI
jgi:hypothetical protein